MDSTTLSLPCEFRGFALKAHPQHGQFLLDPIMKISQTEQRLCPDSYRPVFFSIGFFTA